MGQRPLAPGMALRFAVIVRMPLPPPLDLDALLTVEPRDGQPWEAKVDTGLKRATQRLVPRLGRCDP